MSIENPDQPESSPRENEGAKHERPGADGAGRQGPPNLPLTDGDLRTLDPAYTELAKAIEAIRAEMARVLIGRGEHIELMMAALLTDGHVLLEGVPGIAKTLTAKLLARTLDVDFSRIQFTPDLMPSDIVGTTVFDMKRSEFHFKKGPIFSHVILIDEINRAPAKTQAALMEVMEEKQVTVDGHTYEMPPPFFVVATQNPVEHEGTYKLPEAQLDRFMFKLTMDYPGPDEEKEILKRFRSDFYGRGESEVKPVVDGVGLINHQATVEGVYIKDELLDYIATIVSHTRNNSDLFLGASPRASINILKGSKAMAVMAGRDFVTPDDIKKVVFPVLNHRLILSYERELEGMELREVIDGILRKTEVPR